MLCSNMKMKYLQMMNIDVHKIVQGFQGTHVAERPRTHRGLKIAVSLNLLSTLLHTLGPPYIEYSYMYPHI